jgi:hypothetical protein
MNYHFNRNKIKNKNKDFHGILIPDGCAGKKPESININKYNKLICLIPCDEKIKFNENYTINSILSIDGNIYIHLNEINDTFYHVNIFKII